MGQFSPHPHFSSFGVVAAWEVVTSWGCGSIFMRGFGVEARGIGQSFFNSTRLPDLVPALDHGMPAWVGTFSSNGGLLLGVPPWGGFSISELIVTLGAVLGGCMVILLVLGVDSGLATTHTVYLYLEMSFLLFSVVFVSFCTRGLVLGWAGLD